MQKLYDVLDYKSLDIRENILLLSNKDVSDKEQRIILNDLTKQIKELSDAINDYVDAQKNN